MNKKRVAKIPDKYRKEVEHRLNSLSRSIQARREQLGLTQEYLAEQLGISPMTIQFVEQRRRYPSLPLLVYICLFLKMDVKIGSPTKR